MKKILFIIIFIIIFTIITGYVFVPGHTVHADQSDPSMPMDEIIKKANHMALYQGTSFKARVHLKIIDKQGRTRQRTLNILRRDNSERDEGQKYFTYFQAPADVRKMVFMVHKYATGKDDRWLYMPAMDLVKRIASSDKRTSFVGSDFLYEDISGRGITEDFHELIKTTDTHYILKNVPKEPERVEFEYYLAYVDKLSFISVKMEFYKKNNVIYRVMEVKDIKDIKAMENNKEVLYPSVTKSMVTNLATGTRTEMTISKIKYNLNIGDDFFTERYLRNPPREVLR